MAISVVNRNKGNDAATTGTVTATFPSNSLNNTLIVIGVADAASTTLATPTDSAGNAYTLVQTYTGLTVNMKCWVNYSCAISVTTNTVSMGDSFNDAGMFIFEVAGLASSGAFDKSAGQQQSSATAPTSGNTATTTNANELLIGVIGHSASNTPLPTVGAGYSNLQTFGESFLTAGCEEQIVASTGTYAATFGLAANSANATTAIFTFSDTAIAGGGGAVAHRLSLLGVGK